MASLWFLACLAVFTFRVTCLAVESPPLTVGQVDDFYNYSCNANTFNPSFSSFSSIWAMLNAMVVLVTTVVYLMYLCFNKFLVAVTHACN